MTQALPRLALFLAVGLVGQLIHAQDQMSAQRPTTIVAVDPDPGMLVYGPLPVPEGLPAMDAARATVIIARDPFPFELVPGPRKQELLPPPAPPPSEIPDE